MTARSGGNETKAVRYLILDKTNIVTTSAGTESAIKKPPDTHATASKQVLGQQGHLSPS